MTNFFAFNPAYIMANYKKYISALHKTRHDQTASKRPLLTKMLVLFSFLFLIFPQFVYAWTTDLTSPTTTVSVSSYYNSSFTAVEAVDNVIDMNNRWQTANNPTYPVWFKIDFGEGVSKTVERIVLTATTNGSMSPKNMIFYGSNDNSNWTKITTFQGGQNEGSAQTFDFDNSNAYRYYKLDIQQTWDGDNQNCSGLAEIELMEDDTPTPTSTPTPTLTPTDTPTPTPTMTYSEPIPTPTPYVSDSPYSNLPYLHEQCYDGFLYPQTKWVNTVSGYGEPNSFDNWDWPVSVDSSKVSQGAYCEDVTPYIYDSYKCKQDYNLKNDNKLPYDIVFTGYRLNYFVKGDSFGFQAIIHNLPQSLNDNQNNTFVYPSWQMRDSLVEVENYPSHSDIDKINNDGLNFEFYMYPKSNGKHGSITTPQVCLYYYSDDSLYAITEIPPEVGKGVLIDGTSVVNNLTDLSPTTCEFDNNSFLNLPYYFCLFKNWILNAVNFLFIPSSFNQTAWNGMLTAYDQLLKNKAPLGYLWFLDDYDWSAIMTADPVPEDLQFSVPIASAVIGNETQHFDIDLNPPQSISSFMSWYLGIMSVVIAIPFIYDIFQLIYQTFGFMGEVASQTGSIAVRDEDSRNKKAINNAQFEIWKAKMLKSRGVK